MRVPAAKAEPGCPAENRMVNWESMQGGGGGRREGSLEGEGDVLPQSLANL